MSIAPSSSQNTTQHKAKEQVLKIQQNNNAQPSPMKGTNQQQLTVLQSQKSKVTINDESNINLSDLRVQSSRCYAQHSLGYRFTSTSTCFSHFLLCKICSRLMIQPVRLYPCGHTFCKSCILEHNKKISLTMTTKQNKCHVQFPQCGKYYITLQPDLMALALIDDLQVQCLNDGCPWMGSLQRYKVNHKNQCKLKQGGLDKWLQSLNQGVKVISRQRKQRKDTTCIDVQDDVQMEQMEQMARSEIGNCNHSDTKQSLINAANGPHCMHQAGQKHSDNAKQDVTEQVTQIDKSKLNNGLKPILGLNRHRVSRPYSKAQGNGTSIIVDIQQDQGQAISMLGMNKKDVRIAKKYVKSALPIVLDEEGDRHEQKQKSGGYDKPQNGLINQEEIEKNYTKFKMINSYKKRSSKIAQDPHNMTLTRSLPQRQYEDQYDQP